MNIDVEITSEHIKAAKILGRTKEEITREIQWHADIVLRKLLQEAKAKLVESRSISDLEQ